MCLILPEKKGRTSLCRERCGGRRDPGMDAATRHSCLVLRTGQILCAGAEMLFIAWDPGGWAWRSSWELAQGSLQGLGGLAAMWGSVRGAGGMLLAVLPSPRCSIFAEEPRWHPAAGRDVHRFCFPFYPRPQGWRRLERGDAAPSEEGCLSPGRASEGLPQPLVASSRWYGGVRLARLAVSSAVFPHLVQPCHHFLGDNLQRPGMAQELLHHPSAAMGRWQLGRWLVPGWRSLG